MRGVPAIDVVDISAHCRQVRELGGDFYDFVPAASGRVAFAIGDASGKGLAAALMIANVQSSLRTAALFAGEDGAEAIKAVIARTQGLSIEEAYRAMRSGIAVYERMKDSRDYFEGAKAFAEKRAPVWSGR